MRLPARIALATIGCVLALPAGTAMGATINVNSQADVPDFNPSDSVCETAPGNGTCTLRAANTTAATDDVISVPAGTYTLTLGELVVTAHDVTIDGAGVGATIVDGNNNDRVFHVDLAVNGSTPSATISDLTVTRGFEDDTNDEGGGGIFNENASQLNLIRVAIVANQAVAADNGSAFGGGGVSNKSSNGLSITDSTISGNTLTLPLGGGSSGGAGVHSSSGTLTIDGTTISGNVLNSLGSGAGLGGGGLLLGGGPMSIVNSTISGNTATVPSDSTNGGGGMRVDSDSAAAVENVTVTGNTTNQAGDGVLMSSPQTNLSVAGSIVANGLDGCDVSGAGNIVSGGANVDAGASCNFTASGDVQSTNPFLGPLANNGGPTRTHALAAGSPAIDRQPTRCGGGPGAADQRNVVRPKGVRCDSGAYEYDGLSAVVPGCSTTGTVGVNLFPPAGSSATAARFRVDGGTEGSAGASGSPARAAVPVPDGNHSLQYWGQFTPSGLELARHTANVVVDTIHPSLTIRSDQGREGYTVGDRATFSVIANDVGTGLASDPSVSRQSINTRRRRTITIRRTARDNCGNETAASLRVKVLPKPVRGKKVNLIPVSGRVLVSLPRRRSRGSAHTSQVKGRKFIPLQAARQVPVGSLINTRKGRIRLVSARDARARRLQAGQFYSGLFQILQSRKKRAKGLTELRLKGSSFRRCRAGRRAEASTSRRRLSRRRIRRLRARARGRFRTRGRYSAATVRGTVWSITDRCDGTLTKVTQGRVAVRDFRRKRTITLKRGKRYLAKAPGQR